ncbi:hypothetical protein Ddye_006582 [Dipteronia dyeriana]|uniref:Uncharacterized protein n=1 Tax=Dipteronia dyeriana TaxID=168575 RepID=A0AAD9XIG2_9ROSI|nr:hypothetical protein Ddye_006582 [Dipteronia dyeriana]
MLKQSPSKNLRSKGFKVKNVLQICVLLVICIWFLHQVKRSYNENKAFKEDTVTFSEMQSEHESVKLGRKDLHVQMHQPALEKARHGEGEVRTAIEELIENKAEESEDEGRGGGDDEIDGHDQEKSEDEESEEVEDLIDEDDREREDGSEEQESEEMGNQMDDESLSVNLAQYEGERHSEAREEGYKGDGASRALMQNNRATSNEFSSGGLRMLMQKRVENTENIELEPGN